MASGFRDFTSSNLWNSSMTVNPIEDVSGFQRQEEQDADLSENISIDRLTPSFRSIDDLVIKTIVDLYYNKSGDLERSALKLFYHTEAIATTENLFALHQSLTFTFFNPEIFLTAYQSSFHHAQFLAL